MIKDLIVQNFLTINSVLELYFMFTAKIRRDTEISRVNLLPVLHIHGLLNYQQPQSGTFVPVCETTLTIH